MASSEAAISGRVGWSDDAYVMPAGHQRTGKGLHKGTGKVAGIAGVGGGHHADTHGVQE